MAVTEEYIKALQEQKKLIAELGSSGQGLPGLNPDEIAKRLADLDENLSKTIEYYNSQAEAEADKEEKEAEAKGIKETDEQKAARRKAKRDEAQKKIKEVTDRFVETQKDFVNEQVSIIQVNYNVIEKEVGDLPKTITLATTTSVQPAALGAAAPNPLFNLGVLFQILSSIKRSLGNIKTAFLNMLIAADKIKFVLPPSVTNLLQKILAIEKSIGGSLPNTSDIDQPPPAAPAGTEITVKTGEYRALSGPGALAVVTADNLVQARKGQTGQIVDYIKDTNGTVTSVKIRLS